MTCAAREVHCGGGGGGGEDERSERVGGTTARKEGRERERGGEKQIKIKYETK